MLKLHNMKFILLFILLVHVVYVLSKPTEQAHHTSHSGAQALGGHNKAGKDEEHKKTKVTESKTQHDFEKSRTGQTGKVIHKTEHEEGGGKKHTHHDEGAHKSSEHHEGGSNDGLKYEDGAKHKKLNFKKAFREKYHKDEEKRSDRFYSDHHKDGEYQVYGSKHAKHASNQGSKVAGGNHKKSSSGNKHSKANAKGGGHSDQKHAGHSGGGQTSSHHQHGKKWGKKGGSKGGKQYHTSSSH